MPQVLISAARFRSLLANRHRTLADLEGTVAVRVDLSTLVTADQMVDLDDVKALARSFKRPWPDLLLDEPEAFPDLGQDNRTLANQRVPPSADLIAEFEAVHAMLANSIELFPEDQYLAPTAPITLEFPAAEAGADIRDFLGVTEAQQLHSPSEHAALRLWVNAVQAQRVYVSQRRLHDPTVRAFSATLDGHAVIVVDTGDTPYPRTFSLLHEYCHLVLRSAGICDLDRHSRVERYCNQVTSYVLVPPGLYDETLATATFTDDDDTNDQLLRRLSNQLRISQAALLIRMRQEGTITDAQFDAIEARRSTRRAPDASSGGPGYYVPAINRVGTRFAHNVFDALADQTIDRADASALLGVAERNVLRFYDHLVDRPGAPEPES